MDAITEVFLEGWDDAQQTRQHCDARVAELEQRGFHCTVGLFYNILTGNRIYLLEAVFSPTADPEIAPQHTPQRSSSPRSSRPKPRSTAYQDR